MSVQSIFITGGGGGMGLATGRLFAEKGWKVGLFDLDEDALAKAAAALPAGSVLTRKLDVTDAVDFAAAVESFSAFTDHRMDILFNNAGIAPGGWFDEMSDDIIGSLIDVNVMGVIHGIRASLPLLKATDNALCMSTSSSVATYGHAMRAVYSASKFAVKGLTEALSLEFEQIDIRTADVLPGCIDTPMLRRELSNGAGRPFESSMLKSLPREGPYRLMPASAIADAVWEAYQNSDPIHFYVPEEVGHLDKTKAQDIGLAREEVRGFSMVRKRD